MRSSMRHLLLLLVGVSLHARSAGLEVLVKDAGGAGVADAVASLHAVATKDAVRADRPVTPAVMDQRDLRFVPRVLAIEAGTPVMFPNSDQVRHHVYSFSPAKKFELRLYKATPTNPIVFDTPGVVTIGCNIHDWMLGYIVVLDTPFFAKSDAAGKLRIESLPAGDYRLDVWHARQKDGSSYSENLHMVEGAKPHAVILALRPPEPEPAPPSELEQKFRKYRKATDGT